MERFAGVRTAACDSLDAQYVMLAAQKPRMAACALLWQSFGSIRTARAASLTFTAELTTCRVHTEYWLLLGTSKARLPRARQHATLWCMHMHVYRCQVCSPASHLDSKCANRMRESHTAHTPTAAAAASGIAGYRQPCSVAGRADVVTAMTAASAPVDCPSRLIARLSMAMVISDAECAALPGLASATRRDDRLTPFNSALAVGL